MRRSTLPRADDTLQVTIHGGDALASNERPRLDDHLS
jgi:hypothetical protein